MVQIKCTIKGIDKLQQALDSRKDLTPILNIVKKHGAKLKTKTISNMNAAYTAGYSTGATARSVTNTISDGGLTATVAPHTDYFA